MNELQIFDADVEMSSKEVVDLINLFREQEGNRTTVTPANFNKSIRKEVETLETLGLTNEVNIYFVKKLYKDKKGEWRPGYKLNRNGVLWMGAKESTYVRVKLIQYINVLENKLYRLQLEQGIQEKDRQIKQLQSLLGIKVRHKFKYGKIIKNYLGIKKANADYEAIKQLFFFKLGVEKWEDISLGNEVHNVKLLISICEEFKPSNQIEFNL